MRGYFHSHLQYELKSHMLTEISSCSSFHVYTVTDFNCSRMLLTCSRHWRVCVWDSERGGCCAQQKAASDLRVDCVPFKSWCMIVPVRLARSYDKQGRIPKWGFILRESEPSSVPLRAQVVPLRWSKARVTSWNCTVDRQQCKRGEECGRQQTT